MNFEHYIYRKIAIYNQAVYLVPRDDVLQEIRIVIFSHDDIKTIFRESAKAVYRLLRDYGFRKKRKVCFVSFDDNMNMSESEKETQDMQDEYRLCLLQSILSYYATHTVRETASRFGFKYNQTIQSAFNRYAPKGLGWGGRRR